MTPMPYPEMLQRLKAAHGALLHLELEIAKLEEVADGPFRPSLRIAVSNLEAGESGIVDALRWLEAKGTKGVKS
jgi:hypothetical protein